MPWHIFYLSHINTLKTVVISVQLCFSVWFIRICLYTSLHSWVSTEGVMGPDKYINEHLIISTYNYYARCLNQPLVKCSHRQGRFICIAHYHTQRSFSLLYRNKINIESKDKKQKKTLENLRNIIETLIIKQVMPYYSADWCYVGKHKVIYLITLIVY